MRFAAILPLLAAAILLWLPEISPTVEMCRTRKVAERAAELAAQARIVVTYEEDTDPPARLLALPRPWQNKAIAPEAVRRELSGLRPDFVVEESRLGLHVIPAHRPSLLDTRVTIPRQNRTLLQSVEAVCREVSRLRGVPLIAEWGGETLNVGPDQLYWGALDSPYILWGVHDTPARQALVELFAPSKTSFAWRQTCDSGCRLAILLRQEWKAYDGRWHLETVVRDHCGKRPDGRTNCAWPDPPPPPRSPRLTSSAGSAIFLKY